jgi:hypothetical protein
MIRHETPVGAAEMRGQRQKAGRCDLRPAIVLTAFASILFIYQLLPGSAGRR